MIDTIKMIKREMKLRHLSITELSRKIGLHQSTVHGMLRRNTIQVQKLAVISEALQYNFFKEIAEQLPYEKPLFDEAFKQKEMALSAEINRLEEENKELKIKIGVFKEVITSLNPVH